MTLRVLVCDDEAVARRRLLRLLAALDVEVVGECDSGEAALEAIAEEAVDVVLLDVQMPGLSGVDTLKLLGEDGPTVVFTTAHPDFAVDAFDGGAVDYLLKPIDAGRLARALDRVRSRTVRPESDRLALSTAKGVVLLAAAEISHVVLDGVSTVVVSDRGRFLTELRLADVERRLPAAAFERVHRQALVNLDRVERLEPVDSGGYLAHLRGGAIVAVSRASARRLRRRFGI